MKHKRLVIQGISYIMRDKTVEILRLWESGFNKSQISKSVKIHRETVRSYISRAKAFGIKSTDLETISEARYQEIFCTNQPGRKRNKAALNYEHISIELKKRGVTLQLLWEEYLSENPAGCSYSIFCNRYSKWAKTQKVSMRIAHKAGEKSFVDYSGMKFPIYNKDKPEEKLFEAEIFVGVLGASNYTYLEASQSQKLINWIGSHVRMFEYFGGVTEITVPDNLKSGVTKADYYEPGINKTYHDFAKHYGTAIIPARPDKPKDKSKVENAVLQVQRRALAVLRNQKFFSIAELNIKLKELMEALNKRIMKIYSKSRWDLYIELDKPALKPLPLNKYIFATYKVCKVNIDYHIEIFQHYYSVPCQHVGEHVEVKISEKLIEIYLKGQRVSLHPKSYEKGRFSTIKEHMPAKHRYMEKWTPMRFMEWAGRIGVETKIQINSVLNSRKVPEQTYRSCLGILSLAKKHSNYKLECACKTANQFGAVSVKSIKNIIENKHHKNEQEYVPMVHSNIRGDTEFH
jgi:transposase